MFHPARWHRSTAGTDPERPIVPHPLRAAAAIVGAVDAVSPDGRLGRSDAQLEVEVIRGALEDASLTRSEEHTSELQSLMRISYAVFCLKKKKNNNNT